VYRETSSTVHRKIDRDVGIEMNIKVPYRLAIFVIIIERLIFEIVLMRAREAKRSAPAAQVTAQPSLSNIGCRRCVEARREPHRCSVPAIAILTSRRPTPKNSRRWSLRTISITI